ncbi:hypothetical protein HYV11_03840 [Candidatus Dependentiae bacterium]|nr:hypothetical protein [Candidatus Dependentiae bacterium]
MNKNKWYFFALIGMSSIFFFGSTFASVVLIPDISNLVINRQSGSYVLSDFSSF